ncbi:L-Aspartase-like protein [Xylariaceae sp. FL1272]|nr:L-Aspartase-like protein [Xylariaceae sp. FL1272]
MALTLGLAVVPTSGQTPSTHFSNVSSSCSCLGSPAKRGSGLQHLRKPTALPQFPVVAKEGLALVNGTAISAAVAAYECTNLAALSQTLTVMTLEALCGTDESFDPFIAAIRPHPGQIDSTQNLFRFLSGSRLINSDEYRGQLRQDRYSMRTASQWIGPVVEDIQLAYEQITVELNSVTDNPLIDRATGTILHGGNFQAKVVTSAVEKLRQGLQSLGRMLFSQCTELITHATNRGLPPNLVADDTATSYLFKGTDTSWASWRTLWDLTCRLQRWGTRASTLWH